jgi:uncharacterized protein
MNLASETDPSPRVVLDTNSVLDWLVFRDPGMAAVSAAIQRGQLVWLACAATRIELAHMLQHPRLAHWQHDPAAALALCDTYARYVDAPMTGVTQRLRCTDPDDQIFIDLAVTQHARWLLTHDRALLKLARRARASGVIVVRPVDWQPVALVST